ncbi:MAG: nucleotidyl transferase AbiEii/AbiGii toxin family protein, partial [Coriobacteriia bacterium]|nr:nucleotidyl transferase AbiEii/AbiGii toxin family protein [Coriobacteriia bacterium]
RFGDVDTRFSDDLDTVQGKNLDSFIEALKAELSKGWNGFTGHVVSKPPAKPEGILPQYVMQPFEVKLSYNSKPWLTVNLEVGHNEIGDADEPDWGIASDVIAIFKRLGFPAPEPVPLMQLRHQIAQKLHGASEPGSKRVHDLIDLQRIASGKSVNYRELKTTCVQLFAYRNMQPWPPIIVKGENWDFLYADQIGSLPVVESVDDAIAWTNGLITAIDSAV